MRAAVMSFCLKNGLPDGASILEPSVDDTVACLRLAADEGIDAVEVYGGGFSAATTHSSRSVWPGDLRSAAARVRKAAEETGVETPIYGSAVRLGLPAERRQEVLAVALRELEACGELGATVYVVSLVDGPPRPPAADEDVPDPMPGRGDDGMHFERVLPAVLRDLAVLTEAARTHGVRVAVVNHGAVCAAPWQLDWLLRLAGDEAVGACVDPGNFLQFAVHDPADACRTLGPRAVMARANDLVMNDEAAVVEGFRETGRLVLHRAALFGQGVVDQAACYGALAAAGFDGWVSLKNAGTTEAPGLRPGAPGADNSPATAIRASFANLRAVLASA